MTTRPPLHKRYFKELRELVYLSGPILGAQLATTGMSFVDTSMAGQYSAEDLAAVAIGSSIWNTYLSFDSWHFNGHNPYSGSSVWCQRSE